MLQGISTNDKIKLHHIILTQWRDVQSHVISIKKHKRQIDARKQTRNLRIQKV